MLFHIRQSLKIHHFLYQGLIHHGNLTLLHFTVTFLLESKQLTPEIWLLNSLGRGMKGLIIAQLLKIKAYHVSVLRDCPTVNLGYRGGSGIF